MRGTIPRGLTIILGRVCKAHTANAAALFVWLSVAPQAGISSNTSPSSRLDPPENHSRPPRKRLYKDALGFALIELAAVLAIVALVAAISIPVFIGAMRAYQLDMTGQLIVGQLSLGRQKALTTSRAVQVRFYYLSNSNQQSGGPAAYRGMQCFVVGDPPANGAAKLIPIGKAVLFRAPVVISTQGSPNISPLLQGTPVMPGASDPGLPGYEKEYGYVAFHFRPDGSTDLSSGNTAITLVLENDAPDRTTGLPRNFQTLVIDRMIGTVRVFRP